MSISNRPISNEKELQRRKELTGISREQLIDLIIMYEANAKIDLRTIENRTRLAEKLELKIRKLKGVIDEPL